MSKVKFYDFTAEVEDAINESIDGVLEECAGEIESAVKDLTRVGQAGAPTKNSWKHKVIDSEHTAYIGSNYENAIWEEFGTGEFAIPEGGGGRKGAWYVPVDKVVGYKKPSFNGQVIIVHGKDGQKFYKTNGKKPSRAFWKAYEANKNKIIKKLNEALKGL